jgi:tetraacyldisaccharide 4'-kinase
MRAKAIMREPAFWWRAAGLKTGLLAPLAAVYGGIAGARMRRAGGRADVPVICIGNLTVGGAGKTPTVLAVARMLIAAGERPFFLTRGYGGSLAGPLRVDAARHRAAEVGDEPLMLARIAPTVVAHDRVAGATIAERDGATVIVMDDGFQNPSLAKDFSLIVIDAGRGIGNGRVLPAGPLRAPLAVQFDRADAVLMIGEGAPPASALEAAIAQRNLPLYRGRMVPDAAGVAALADKRVLAFAGIGDPGKFFASLAASGIKAAATRGFPDHHRFTRAEAHALCEDAERAGLTLVTTEKDLARMTGDIEAASLVARAHTFPVRLEFAEEAALGQALFERLTARRRSSQVL